MCLPPGILRVEMRGSRPALVHYGEESRPARCVKSVCKWTQIADAQESHLFQTTCSPRETGIEVRPGCTPLLPDYASAVRSPWILPTEPAKVSRKRRWMFGIRIGKSQSHKGMMRSTKEQDTASLLDILLHKVTHLIGLKADREREIGFLKKQLMEEQRQVPGEISHLAGYSRRESVDQPSLHGSRRRSSSSHRYRSVNLPRSPRTVAAPPATPANWQYPYGCQVSQMAVPDRAHSRKRYRRSISEHNAKYSAKERKSSKDECQSPQSHIMSREESDRTTMMTAVEESSFTTALTQGQDEQEVGHVVIPSKGRMNESKDEQEEEREEDEKEQDQVLEKGEGTIYQTAREISKEPSLVQPTSESQVTQAREMEQRIKDAPDLATGLGIFMEAVGGHVAHVNQQAKASKLAVQSLDDKLYKIGRAYSEMESRLIATVDKQQSTIHAIGNQADRMRTDMNAILLDHKSEKTAEETRGEVRKGQRQPRIKPKISWAAGEAQRSWFSEL